MNLILFPIFSTSRWFLSSTVRKWPHISLKPLSSLTSTTSKDEVEIRDEKRSTGRKYSSNTVTKLRLNKEMEKEKEKEKRGNEQPFQLKRALVLTKFSRYEFEKRRHSDWTEKDLISNVWLGQSTPHSPSLGGNFADSNASVLLQLKMRGSDYNNLLHHHGVHSQSRDHVIETLQSFGVETKIVNRFDYSGDMIDWADAIFTTGGDGTFLMAASKVSTPNKPVIGINSDPSRSVGYLCLPSHYSTNFREALDKLFTGDFKWLYRQRVRITLQGENANDDPIELHNQQLKYPEYRYLDLDPQTIQDPQEQMRPEGRQNHTRVLPVRALNEVFVGESLSSRASYYEIAVNGSPGVKLKSSGLTVCTGTGSTSWSFNINKVTPQCVQNLFNIIKEETEAKNLPTDPKTIQKVTQRFNNSLIFDPENPVMAYTIRDPVVFGTDFNSSPRGFADKIEVRSRMFDACVVVDGALSYKFNDGATAKFELFEEDALKTIALNDQMSNSS